MGCAEATKQQTIGTGCGYPAAPEVVEFTLRDLEGLTHQVSRDTLEFYDTVGAWTWFYLTDTKVTLAELVAAFQKRDLVFIDELMNRGTLRVCRSLQLVPGDSFRCIYYKDVLFFLGPVSPKYRGYSVEIKTKTRSLGETGNRWRN